MKDPRQVIIKPVVSEKSYSLIDNNVYSFVVHPDSNKVEIRQAVESIWGVRVLKVNTLNRKKATLGQRSATKRAMVTLAEGDSIELFEV